MTEDAARRALEHWGLEACPLNLVAARENMVFRVEAPAGPMALRLHRPGYRTAAALRSELEWMAALAAAGMAVPHPVAALTGAYCVDAGGTMADMLGWVDGAPMGEGGRLTGAATDAGMLALGRALARLHDLSDQWTPCAGFERPAWDRDGLVGDNPLWGRFWDNPALDAGQARLMREARDALAASLPSQAEADYGLIHADAVPENVLALNDGVTLIDFDDGGFGYRLFDLATPMNRLDRHDPSSVLSARLLEGYRAERSIALEKLEAFRLARSLTYVGWIVPRLSEPGSQERCRRFVSEACARAEHLIQGTGRTSDDR